jgi:formate C-acetyltransferase
MLGNGMALDLKFTPDFFESNRQSIRALIETYFSMGGYEIQFNVVDKETLLNAQKNPDNYKNLIVRVSGFSAYFVDLNALLQNEIIARTAHS